MKYKIYCPECASYKEIESLLITTKCPENNSHTCDKSSAVIQTALPSPTLSLKGLLSKDYKRLRKELVNYVISNGGNLPPEELAGAAEHFCLPIEIRSMFYDLATQAKQAEDFYQRMKVSRADRFSAASGEFIVRLTFDQTIEVSQDMSEANHMFNYLELGVEGKIVGDSVEGMYDYMTSYSGSSYSGSGLLSKNWEPTGITLPQLSDRLLGILRDGDY
jgi:hypothetical protein